MANRPVKVVILGDADDAAKAFKKIRDEADKTDSKLSRIGDNLSRTGQGLTLAVTGPLLALGGVATQAAESLGESVNAVNQVFGDAADKIHAFAETSAESVGLSSRAFNELVTPVGAMLQNMGFEADAAADASINLAERASDMASVFNVDVSEALAAIQAGLRGEQDPLEKFGVGLSAAAVEAHAMETGIIGADGALSEHEKTQARVSLLMEQTTRIAGDFADTADETANKTRIETARLEDLGAEIGQQLIPVKAKLLEITSDLITAFSELSPETQGLILKLGGAAAAMGPLLLVTGKLITAMQKLKESKASVVKFLAGPWAAAFAVAGGILVGFLAIQKRAADNQKAWSEALAGGKEAIEEHITALVADTIAARDWDETLAEAGLTAVDVKAAIEGDERALAALNQLMPRARKEILGFVLRQREWRRAEEEKAAAVDESRQAIENAQRIAANAHTTWQGYITDQKKAADATDDVTKSLGAQADKQRALVDPLFNLRDKTQALADAQEEYNRVLVEHGPKSQEAEDAAFELADAQLDANDAAARYATEGGPESVEALEDLLREAGLAEDAIRRITDSIQDLNSTPVVVDMPGSGGQFGVFHQGGVVPGRGERLIVAHGGETVLPTHKKSPVEAFADQFGVQRVSLGSSPSGGGLVVQILGPVYGMDDFEGKVTESVVRARRRGVAV